MEEAEYEALDADTEASAEVEAPVEVGAYSDGEADEAEVNDESQSSVVEEGADVSELADDIVEVESEYQ